MQIFQNLDLDLNTNWHFQHEGLRQLHLKIQVRESCSSATHYKSMLRVLLTFASPRQFRYRGENLSAEAADMDMAWEPHWDKCEQRAVPLQLSWPRLLWSRVRSHQGNQGNTDNNQSVRLYRQSTIQVNRHTVSQPAYRLTMELTIKFLCHIWVIHGTPPLYIPLCIF